MGWEHTDNMGASTFISNAPAHDLNIQFNKSPVAGCTFLALCNIYIDKSHTNTDWCVRSDYSLSSQRQL